MIVSTDASYRDGSARSIVEVSENEANGHQSRKRREMRKKHRVASQVRSDGEVNVWRFRSFVGGIGVLGSEKCSSVGRWMKFLLTA
jgi:hypothetical protein